MQSRTISERIQARAQFCAGSSIDCGAGPSSKALAAAAAPRKQAAGCASRGPRSGKITFFSDTCLKTCGRRARDWDE
jgi:hypothetical protein